MKYSFAIIFFFLFLFNSYSQECSYNQKYNGVKMADQEFIFTLIKPVEVSDCKNWYYFSKPLPPPANSQGYSVGEIVTYVTDNCGDNNPLAYDEWVESGSTFLDASFDGLGLVHATIVTGATRTNPGNPIFSLTGSFPTIVSEPDVEDDNVLLANSLNQPTNANEVIQEMNLIHSQSDTKNSISFRHFEFFDESMGENVVITFATGSSGPGGDLLDDPSELTHNEFDIVINTTHPTSQDFDWYNDGGDGDASQVSNDELTLQASFFITHEMFHAVGLGHIRGSQVNNNSLNIAPIMSTGIDATSINTGYDENDPCVINAVRCLHDDDPSTCEDVMGSSTITLKIASNNSVDNNSKTLEWVSNVFIEDVIGYNILKRDGDTVYALNSEMITPLAANDRHSFVLPKEYQENDDFILEAVTFSGMHSFYNF